MCFLSILIKPHDLVKQFDCQMFVSLLLVQVLVEEVAHTLVNVCLASLGSLY